MLHHVSVRPVIDFSGSCAKIPYAIIIKVSHINGGKVTAGLESGVYWWSLTWQNTCTPSLAQRDNPMHPSSHSSKTEPCAGCR